MSKVPFCYGQPILENDFVRLEPFDPNTHVSSFVASIKANQQVTDYIAFPVVNTPTDFLTTMWDAKFASSAQACLYSVFDKKKKQEEVPDSTNNSTNNSNFAGVISLFDTDQDAAATEIGVMIFPSHQGTHVARNSVGLILLWLMDPPSLGGLGLRRLEWQSHPRNAKSRRWFAERMGLEFGGVLRWKKAFPGGKMSLSAEKLRVRNGTAEEVPGRHTAIYSVAWDEWEEKRPMVVEQMRRG